VESRLPPSAPRGTSGLRSGRDLACAFACGLIATVWFGYGLSSEPHFADESAYVSQTYFLDLLARPNDVRWLEYPAIDLPPLPKYLIGVSLRACRYKLGTPAAMRRWYDNTRVQVARGGALYAARLPSVAMGGLGCGAIYLLGTMFAGRRAGVFAAALLAINPLYRLLARRAMADVPAESLILTTAVIGLGVWRALLAGGFRPIRLLAAILAMGVTAGLAVLAKLNGGLALIVLGAWPALAAVLPGVPARRKTLLAGTTIAAAVIAFATFVISNPMLTARPTPVPPGPIGELARQGVLERTGAVIAHRVEVSRRGQDRFSDDAVRNATEKLGVAVVQGFGRFGPFGPSHSDSTRRYDRAQDWGAAVWGPLVLAGASWVVVLGRRQLRAGAPPTAWAILLQACAAFVTVTAFLPLAWDRYLLPIQSGSALLVAGVTDAALHRHRPARSPATGGV
jgi:4-amino-4-deoxy-L-arabinose transferase-like glycosyltransferase